MKNYLTFFILLFMCGIARSYAQNSDVFTTSVTFPANYAIGDYIEFGQATPIAAGASGYYEISIAYTRGNIAAAATHIASASHRNPDVWREAGRTNQNIYTTGANNFNFTVDVNPGTHRFRIRAVNTLGVTSTPLPVSIKVRSINITTGFTALNIAGHNTVPVGYLSMTSNWDLIVGDLRASADAVHAIKVVSNGNVGIGTTTPSARLEVNGTIRTKEVKVEASPWPDYVFEDDYNLLPLDKLEEHLERHKRLPNLPSAQSVEDSGIELGEMNRKLLEKIEELTLYIISNKKEIEDLRQELRAAKMK